MTVPATLREWNDMIVLIRNFQLDVRVLHSDSDIYRVTQFSIIKYVTLTIDMNDECQRFACKLLIFNTARQCEEF